MTTPATLDDLLDLLTTCPACRAGADPIDEHAPAHTCGDLDWTWLPTFGGEEPRDTSGIWSWDETRLLLGACASDLRIEAREYYHCQIEGDESAVVEARSAEQAARRYVLGGDWSPEAGGWSGTGTLSVWVTPCERGGAHDPDERETVPVQMRDGRVVFA